MSEGRKHPWWIVIGTLSGTAIGAFILPGLETTPAEAILILCFAAVGLLVGAWVDMAGRAR